MIAPTIVGLTSIYLSLTNILDKLKFGKLFVVFAPIFIFLALRFNYGNDYPGYLAMFEEISSTNEMDYDQERWHTEFGWLFLNRLFSGIGFFPMIASLALFNCYIFARLINKFVPKSYHWLAIFFYIFIPENMLVQSSAMRQAVAISLFILSAEFIIKKELVKYLITIAVAALFHTSALLLIPVYLFGSANIPIKKQWIPIFLAGYVALFIYAGELIPMIQASLISEGGTYFERYAIYEDKGALGSGLGVLFYGFYLACLLYFYEKQNDSGKLLFKMSIISIYLIPFSVEISILARIGFYFSVFSITSIPLILVQIKKHILRICFLGVHILYAIWGYFHFFRNPIWEKSFSEYHTILELIF